MSHSTSTYYTQTDSNKIRSTSYESPNDDRTDVIEQFQQTQTQTAQPNVDTTKSTLPSFSDRHFHASQYQNGQKYSQNVPSDFELPEYDANHVQAHLESHMSKVKSPIKPHSYSSFHQPLEKHAIERHPQQPPILHNDGAGNKEENMVNHYGGFKNTPIKKYSTPSLPKGHVLEKFTNDSNDSNSPGSDDNDSGDNKFVAFFKKYWIGIVVVVLFVGAVYMWSRFNASDQSTESGAIIGDIQGSRSFQQPPPPPVQQPLSLPELNTL